MALQKAAIGRIMANGSPRIEYVAMILSTPVSGVAMRKEAVAPLDAPCFLSDMAVGITPQEHNGSGIPNNAP